MLSAAYLHLSHQKHDHRKVHSATTLLYIHSIWNDIDELCDYYECNALRNALRLITTL